MAIPPECQIMSREEFAIFIKLRMTTYQFQVWTKTGWFNLEFLALCIKCQMNNKDFVRWQSSKQQSKQSKS